MNDSRLDATSEELAAIKKKHDSLDQKMQEVIRAMKMLSQRIEKGQEMLLQQIQQLGSQNLGPASKEVNTNSSVFNNKKNLSKGIEIEEDSVEEMGYSWANHYQHIKYHVDGKGGCESGKVQVEEVPAFEGFKVWDDKPVELEQDFISIKKIETNSIQNCRKFVEEEVSLFEGFKEFNGKPERELGHGFIFSGKFLRTDSMVQLDQRKVRLTVFKPCKLSQLEGNLVTGKPPSSLSEITQELGGKGSTFKDYGLSEAVPEVGLILDKERQHQFTGLELIASEKFISRAVIEAIGSCLTIKGSGGLPGKRYYGGHEFIEELEVSCQESVLAAFHLDGKKKEGASRLGYFHVSTPGWIYFVSEQFWKSKSEQNVSVRFSFDPGGT